MNKLVLAVLLCTLVTGQEPLIVGQEPPIEPQIEAYTIAYSTDNPVLEFLKLSGPLPAYGIWIFARTTEINAVAFRATVRYEKDGIESEQKTIFEPFGSNVWATTIVKISDKPDFKIIRTEIGTLVRGRAWLKDAPTM